VKKHSPQAGKEGAAVREDR